MHSHILGLLANISPSLRYFQQILDYIFTRLEISSLHSQILMQMYVNSRKLKISFV